MFSQQPNNSESSRPPLQPKPERKRKDLSLEEKMEILIRFYKLPTMSQRNAAAQLGISQPLLCKILKNRQELLRKSQENESLHCKRNRKGKDASVERALKVWVNNVQQLGVTVDGPLLQQKAEELAFEMGKEGFVATSGWFQRWKKRENITFNRVPDKMNDTDFIYGLNSCEEGIVARRMKAFCDGQSPDKRSRKGEPSKSKSEWDLRKLHDDPPSPEVKKPPEDLAQLKRAEYIEQLEASPNDLPVRDGTPSVASNYLDLNVTPLTKELCEKVSDDLKKVTSFAVQLFQRVTIDSQLSTTEKAAMTTTLAQGVWQAQQNLQPTAFTRTTPSENSSEPQAAMVLLQQYSDKLLNLIEQRISK